MNKTTHLSHQEKAKRNDTNSKTKSKRRHYKAVNVKISAIKVGDKIFAKQRNRNKLTTLYKSETFTVTEKKGNTFKIRAAYGNERVQNVADVRCFYGGLDSLHKVPKKARKERQG